MIQTQPSACITMKMEKKLGKLTLRPTQIGMPMTMAGTAMPATSVMPSGAPTKIPNCHRIFFLRLHGLRPQNVHPDGLQARDTQYQRSCYHRFTFLFDQTDLKLERNIGHFDQTRP
jgi:hypothetical protein